MNAISFEFCNFNKDEHITALHNLLHGYMADPMGDYPVHTPEQQKKLIEGLRKHPGVFVVLVLYDGEFVGMATYFELFSTFNVRPYMNIHDVFVLDTFRGKGLGKQLMEHLIQIALVHEYCKITLEVREDNVNAQRLYHSLAFKECDPLMHFWTKKL